MWRAAAALSLFVVTAATNLSPPPAPSPPPQGVFDVDVGALPPVATIIDKMIARAEAQDETSPELGYEARIITRIETLDGDGEVTKTEHRLHRRYAVEDQLFEELIARDGEPLDDKERREQAERRREFAREVRRRARNGDARVETNDERQVRLDRDLMARFQASVVGVRPIDDEPHYVVAFQPRDDKLPAKTRIDQALNHSAGTLYISREDYGLRRVEFETQRSVRFFLGLARLRHASGRLEFERIAQDVWLPKRYDFGIDLRVVFRSRRQRIEREWIERRPLEAPPA